MLSVVFFVRFRSLFLLVVVPATAPGAAHLRALQLTGADDALLLNLHHLHCGLRICFLFHIFIVFFVLLEVTTPLPPQGGVGGGSLLNHDLLSILALQASFGRAHDIHTLLCGLALDAATLQVVNFIIHFFTIR